MSLLPKNYPRANTTEGVKLWSELSANDREKDGASFTALTNVAGLIANSTDDKPAVHLRQYADDASLNAAAGEILIELGRAFGKVIKLREVVCGTACDQYCLVLCSEPYASPLISGETPIGSDTETP